MNHLLALPRPAIFGHRGASAHAPENTLAAFRLAHSQGAEGIEFDVRLTGDGQVAVIHDDSVGRTTDGAGRVSRLPLAALREFDAGAWCDPAFAGERIPTLEEVLEMAGDDLILNIELKPAPGGRRALAAAVAARVRRHARQAQVLLSSFDRQALALARRALPETATGVLAMPGAAGGWARWRYAGRGPHRTLHLHHSDVSPRLLRRAHRAGQALFAYTVNAPEDLRRLFALGVDGIFTDDPALAGRVRRGEGA
ncbi:MAG: glycerophosphodiester phosphodiesterase [Chloroflexi bacterium]|nr:glycerophosphodiester phosphodiesterase [Chloroflexota bacterium]